MGEISNNETDDYIINKKEVFRLNLRKNKMKNTFDNSRLSHLSNEICN